jgi:hypothetical protein
MRELVTTLLDTAGLLLLAAGVAGGLWTYIGPWALCPGGVVVLAGSWVAAWQRPSP